MIYKKATNTCYGIRGVPELLDGVRYAVAVLLSGWPAISIIIAQLF